VVDNHKYETTEIVGLDAVFIHLAENYYLKDADWLDSTQRNFRAGKYSETFYKPEKYFLN
jgi:hypothetical protein